LLPNFLLPQASVVGHLKLAMITTKGLESISSKNSVDDTVRRLTSVLEKKGIKLFAVVDHSGEAQAAGLQLRPTKLLIFGNPAAGTPIMQATQTAAIDLPLKLLVWEDEQQQTWISWNTPEYLRQRHGFPQALEKNITVVKGLAEAASRPE
jgi:uncharacterized protein (DUF302 family)